MAIYDLFSKRQKRLRGDFPDVYQYEEIPLGFRNQVVHIICDTISTDKDTFVSALADNIYKQIHSVLSKEYGVLSLKKANYDSDRNAVLNCFIQNTDIIHIQNKIQMMQLTN